MPYSRLQRFLSRITARSDVMLAVFLVTIAFMMILPMPTLLIDILLATNLTGAILLLMMAVYISSPLMFSSFPAVLLLTTLFRLALSISTTRLILSQADAGKIVQTFGDFVVGGNLVVGFVIFLIITIVQFIVITKGSERVAEVSARFSLDAMPGKQMSIDSDLRSGVVTLDDARARRQRLEKESQLFGSMDGAMKFVKGDAIAGLVIIFVNMIGGISIGMLQNGMDISSATGLYSILTIGDGLVAQIPALFIAITAGIIVTRVTVDEKSNLGDDIGKQILAQPLALLAASGVVFLMGFVPGFPTPVFVFLGIMLALIGTVLYKTQSNYFNDSDGTSILCKEEKPSDMGTESLMEAGATPSSPVLVEISEKARVMFSPATLNTEFIKLRGDLYNDLGIMISGIAVRFVNNLGDDEYVINIQDIPAERGHLGAGKVYVAEKNNELESKQIPYQTDEKFLPGLPTVWVDQQHSSKIVASGIKTLTPTHILTYHLAYALRKHASQLIGIQETHGLLRKLESAGYTELFKEAQQIVSVPLIAEVVKRLVSEGVSVRNLRQILESIVTWGEKEKDPAMLTEYVRTDMKRQISYAFTGGTNILPAYLLSPESENIIRNSMRQSPSGNFLALEPEVSQQFVELLRKSEDSTKSNKVRSVLVSSTDLRRFIRTHLQLYLPDLPILAFTEITPTTTLNPLSTINLGAAEVAS